MKYAFVISQNYSFEILRPLQAAALKRDAEILWFVDNDPVDTNRFYKGEHFTTNVQDVIDFQPDACFVPGNVIPSFVPGLKVQVFHGLEFKKKGHFRIRDCFDLYCTQGALFTEQFNLLAQKHNNFDVIETGWPKLDPLFSASPMPLDSKDKPVVLYAPTFSPSFTSGPALYEMIKDLSTKGSYHWLIKFHPKMDVNLVEKYKALQHERLTVVEDQELAPILQAADVMVSDTSSIITEFMLLKKPVVTYKNLAPEPCLIDIDKAEKLEGAIASALNPDEKLLNAIKTQNKKMHPYQDGLSSNRVLDAVEKTISEGKESGPLPRNLFRNLKLRKKFGYWKV